MGLCQSGDTYHRPACPAPSLYWFLKGTYKIWRICNALLFIHGQPEAVPTSERETGNVLGAKSTARTRVGLVASRVHSPGLSILSRLVLVFGGVIRNFLGGAPIPRLIKAPSQGLGGMPRLFHAREKLRNILGVPPKNGSQAGQ